MGSFVNLGLDMGTSGWKVGHKNNQFYLTSLVARGPLREQVNGIFAADSRENLDNIAINTDSGLFFVGNIAKFSQSPAWSGYGQERYVQSDFIEPMTLAAMSEARLTGNDPVVITTAIPAKWEEATAFSGGKELSITEAIKYHFLRDHTIDRDGQRGQRTVSVDEVKVLTEIQALLYSFLLDKGGQISVDNYNDIRIAVVDIGELTTCGGVFRGLSLEGESFTNEDVSMGKVHKSTAAQVFERTGRSFQHWEIRDIVQAGGQIMIPSQGKRPAQSFDITPIYHDNVSRLRPVLRSVFGDHITRAGDIHYIIIGGGGSESIGKILADTYRQAQIVGQFATLQGLRNYGERLCAIKNRT